MRSPVLFLRPRLLAGLSLLGLLSACGGGGGGYEGEEVIDATPPVVLAVYPAADATGIDPPTLLQAWFDDRLDPASANTATFLLYDGAGQPVAGAVSYSDLYGCWSDGVTHWCGYTVEFAPTTPLQTATRYTAILTTGVQNASGYSLARDFLWTFTTAP